MLQLSLHDVIPAPLQERSGLTSEIWGQEVVLERSGSYQMLAPSGRGKSTLLHLLYGLRHDFTGRVELDGMDSLQIDKAEWATIRQSRISIVFQDLRLFPHLTALENVSVKSELKSLTRPSETVPMFEALGIEGVLGKPCGNLSYGERQRVAIVRALVQPFDWLFLDEPFSHLDAANIEKASSLIQEHCKRRDAGCLFASLDRETRFEFRRTYLL